MELKIRNYKLKSRTIKTAEYNPEKFGCLTARPNRRVCK